MHWQPAERRHEANCRRSMRPAHGRCGDGGHDHLSHRRGLRCLGAIADHRRGDAPKRKVWSRGAISFDSRDLGAGLSNAGGGPDG
jgi:hypothetical protein